jgi:hypothetical protein
MKGNKFSVELEFLQEILRGIVDRERDFSNPPKLVASMDPD